VNLIPPRRRPARCRCRRCRSPWGGCGTCPTSLQGLPFKGQAWDSRWFFVALLLKRAALRWCGSRVLRAVDSRPQGAHWLDRCCRSSIAGTAQDGSTRFETATLQTAIDAASLPQTLMKDARRGLHSLVEDILPAGSLL